jgi:radical SAM protein with 4Fe4S-binding SPASM domain
MSRFEEVQVKLTEYRDFSAAIHGKVDHQKRFIKAQFELTYACNLHCVHCYTDPLNRPELLKKELPYEKVIAALDKLHEEEIFWLCFTGGEIFMRKDFLRIYDYAHQKGFLITLFTNGTPITEKIASHLAEKRPFSIEISFHGATPETFDKITQVKGSFEKCVQGIKLLLAQNLPVKLKTKAMTLNREELGAIQTFVENLGLKFSLNAIIFPRLDGDTSSCEYRLSSEEIVKLEFLDDDEELGTADLENCSTVSALPSNIYRCGCGKIQMHIDPYGQVGACTWSRKGRFDFSEKGIQRGMTELAHALHAEMYNESSSCHSCVASPYCHKQPEMATYESGNIQNPVPHFCDVAFKRLEKMNDFLERKKK